MAARAMTALAQRQGIYRNRKLLDLARVLPCQAGLDGCRHGPTCAGHSNQIVHGKGWAIKSHDCFVAALDAPCHEAIDNGSKLSRVERRDTWAEAWHWTFVLLHGAGYIVLPELGLAELVESNGGAMPVDPAPTIVAYPRTVPDDVWLDFWFDGRARVT